MHRFVFVFLFCIFGITHGTLADPRAAVEHLKKGDYTSALVHAETSGDPDFITAVTWYYLKNNPQISEFPMYRQFLARHPNWPEREKLETRAEIALMNSIAPAGIREQWFRQHPPRTARGKFFHLESLRRLTPDQVRTLWIEGDFPDDEEEYILRTHGSQLDTATHIKRVDRLLWEGQVTSAKHLYSKIPETYRAVAEARIGLMRSAPGVEGLLRRVPSSYQNDPGLLYERARWRFSKKLYDGVTEILLQAPANPPYPAKWWPMRSYMIREMQQGGRTELALTLAKQHGQVSKVERADALWLLGWTAFSFRNEYDTARAAFSELYSLAEFPVSKSRGAYWRGRVAKADGDPVAAASWFRKAAIYPTTFYGQLAHAELAPGQPLKLSKGVSAAPNEAASLLSRSDIARAAQRLVAYGGDDYAIPLLLHLARNAPDAQSAAAVADLGIQLGRKDFAVRAAKEALNKGFILSELYPSNLPQAQLFGDKLLVLSITRQESMFNPRAVSPANAIGMMQMLPSTAKIEAKKLGVGYSPARLYEAPYNLHLGSFHLQRLVEKMGGSYIMAAAGYNAGPSRPEQWRYRFGDPRRSLYDAIQWIESIPYGETRNYVQRVMENYQVYRAVLTTGHVPLSINEVLTY